MSKIGDWLRSKWRWSKKSPAVAPAPVPVLRAPMPRPRVRLVVQERPQGIPEGQVFTTDQHPSDGEWTPTPGTVYDGLPPGLRKRR